ncbi:MAG: chaperone NapD [Nitrospirae bacterium]|nr:chaperone NapD [Nitrospirota bacterium]
MKGRQDLPMNVSSLVIKTAPEHVEKVIGLLKASGLCEVFFHDTSGKIIVTIEGRDVSDEMRKLKAIQALAHVAAADLVYSYSEHEVMEDLMKIDNVIDPVPEALRSSETA